ncbi:MAG: PAS domain S-box protein [Promethearchaeia archaeon]
MRKKFYDTLLKTSPDAIIILDTQGMIIDVSESLLDIYHIEDKKEIIGEDILPFIKEELRDIAKQNFELAKKRGALKDLIYEFEMRDGNQYIGNISLTTINDENGNPEYVIAVMRDITEQKLTEKKLRESEKMFQLVLDNIPQFIYWKDINSVYLGCNENFARVAGIEKPENIVGKTDYDLAWDKSEADSFVEIDQLVMESDTPEYHIIEPQLQAEGKRAWLDTNRVPLHDSKGNVVGVLGTYEDITNRVRAKKALKRSEEKYRQAYNRAEFYKDIFAHDVSNLLQNILTSIELCEMIIGKPDKDEDRKELYEKIKNQVERGEKLVTNVRKLSYLENLEKTSSSLDLTPIIERAIVFLLEKFPDKNISFKRDYEVDASCQVLANDLLYEVFTNLFLNAVKHNESEEIKITVKISEKLKDSTLYAQIEIIDNGKGIVDVQKKVIFELEKKEKLSLNRIGLGLSMVKQIINRFNGEIWVENRIPDDYSQGSKFILLIPKAE